MQLLHGRWQETGAAAAAARTAALARAGKSKTDEGQQHAPAHPVCADVVRGGCDLARAHQPVPETVDISLAAQPRPRAAEDTQRSHESAVAQHTSYIPGTQPATSAGAMP